MLATEQRLSEVTYFNYPQQDEFGRWFLTQTRNEKVIKKTFALNEKDAWEIRGMWVNSFWSNKLN